MAFNQRSLDRLQSENKKKRCPECNGEIIYSDGEMVCCKCGLIMD